MKAWEISEQFGLDRLTLVQRPDPVPTEDEVLIKIATVSLNYRDLMMVQGRYNPRQALPLVPVSDGAGYVVACGKQVRGFKVGDRVCGTFAQGWEQGKPTKKIMRQHTLGGPLDGMLQDFRALRAEGLLKVPDYLSDEQAATLPCAALTAWSALNSLSPLAPSDSVLCQGSGGVSVFALQFAKAMGCKVIALSSSPEKAKALQALGADAVVNYKQEPQWAEKVKQHTQGEGVDKIIEVGGSGSLQQSLSAIKEGGTINIIGVLSGDKSEHSLIPILMKQIALQGIFVGHKKSFIAMLEFMQRNMIEPVVDKVYAFEEAVDAFKHLQSGTHLGKIVIRVND